MEIYANWDIVYIVHIFYIYIAYSIYAFSYMLSHFQKFIFVDLNFQKRRLPLQIREIGSWKIELLKLRTDCQIHDTD